ncbi:MBL fold metallo-hydrolase [Pseudogracilibacillus auburnensis]|uniref:Glyoxylase-like metal-dependent hydrolase (Beta-lactamase superfamily II) n=1 Tax=Pseudogracilibacillus auburnensis TaxID=1494959 RepID=A0A2V3WCJ3_9BACI|nr:MBL fold metallo-hydrolase [Pseudogracilibacillus auburnensis]PXW86489.1 glyoxylase-like metal-dependent hydrolase (beta-lactamase superfamily II) [Pseudogracilibacillus auburnensis]
MEIQTLSLGPLGTNCYIVSKNNECLIFDPGGDANLIVQYVTKNKLTPKAILLTHAHFDHIGAVDLLRKKYAISVYLHENEKDWLDDPSLNRSSLFFGRDGGIKTEKPEHILTEGTIQIGAFSIEVIHTPGHSPGSVTFIFKEEKLIVSGDVLFQQGIGRTDLPEGSINELANSIVTKLYTLPNECIVYPGHGPNTTIGSEKASNPFTRQFYTE